MKYKYNGQWVDVNIKALDSMAIGCIIQFMGTTIPTGWLECDGSTITQANYPELYDLIGGTLPDFRGRVLVGQKTSDSDFDTLGETGGSKSNTLTYPFGWTDDGRLSINQANWNSGGLSNLSGQWTRRTNATDYATGIYSGTETQKSVTLSSVQPYGVVKHIIKAKNTVPTMASIVDARSTSTTDGYSCNYVNGKIGEVLWTNPDIGASFGNVILNIDTSKYNIIEIFYHRYQSDRRKFSIRILNEGDKKSQLFYSDYDNGVRSWNRNVDWNNTAFEFAHNTINGSTNDNGLIPIKIIGYK